MTTPRQVSPTAPRLRAAEREDLDAVVGLLGVAGLPTAGLSATLADFYVAEQGGRIVGAIGLEPYGAAALLRSAVVEPAFRGSGVGEAMIRRILDHAGARGMSEVFLLTTTAERYFPRFGFVEIAREDVPRAVQGSLEFSEACPDSAVVMRLELSTI